MKESEILIMDKDQIVEYSESDLNSERGRIQFLADITNVPITSVITDRHRLLQEVSDWIDHG